MVYKYNKKRNINKDIVEELIRSNAPISKSQLANLSKLSIVSINRIVSLLIQEDKISSCGVQESTGGRRAYLYEINLVPTFYIGLYYHLNHILGAIADSSGKIVFEQTYIVRATVFEDFIDDTYTAINELIERCEDNSIKTISIGVPGIVSRGIVTSSSQIPACVNKDFTSMISDRYHVPVLLDTDINLTTLGLYLEEYRHSRNMALINLDNRLSSGFMINGSLFKGSANFAGELSFIPVKRNLSFNENSTNMEERFRLIVKSIEDSIGSERAIYQNMLIELITDLLTSIICILNPENIILACSSLTKQDFQNIEQKLAAYIGKRNVPSIDIITDICVFSIQGVIQMCINK